MLDVMTQSAYIHFKSDSFPIIPGEDEETNPGLFGKSLAEWLSLRLQEKGLALEAIIAEDFGWCVPVPCPPYRAYVACGVSREAGSDWGVFAFAEGGLFSRLIGRDKRAEALSSLYATVRSCLEEAPEIRNLRQESE